MGICNGNTCCRDMEVIRTGENFQSQNSIYNNNNKKKLFLNNGKSINDNQLILSKEYFQIINEIRENPSNYINESKSHNLLEIFMKLKPSKALKLSENNIFNIISYLEENQEKKSIMEKESEIGQMLNNGKIKQLFLFQTITIGNDAKENFWYFLEENEDDIDKILKINYDYIMVICLPIKNEKFIISFIFYDEID